MDKSYTSQDIKVLSDFEHCRLRTNVYLGNTNPTMYNIPCFVGNKFEIINAVFAPAVFKGISEIIDNSVDELTQCKVRTKTLKINAKTDIGYYCISDNGRGVPIDIHSSGKHTPEVVFGTLRSGRNFDDDTKQLGVMGVNGVGSSVTNACSSEFEVIIHRDLKRYQQKFTNGASKITKPKITDKMADTGTEVRFQLDPVVFKHIAIPDKMMHSKAIELAMTNPGVAVEYNGSKYKFKKGLADLIPQVANGKQFFCFNINEQNIQGQVYVILDAHDQLDEQMFTWINSSLLFDGGKCNTQFFNVLFDQTIKQLEREAKKTKTEVTRNDIRQGLLVLADIKIKNPEYDSQAKTRLTGPDTRKEFTTCIENQWKPFLKVANKWMESVLERAQERHHKSENKKAINDHKKNSTKRIEGLLDATSKDRSICQILLTEGESAKAGCCEARNPETTGAYALTGKINNVYGCTVAQVLKMDKIAELLTILGLTPGVKADKSQLNFGRIVIATDADVDGGDIFTLLINVLYTFWPELFSNPKDPIVFRLVSPNVVVSKGDKRIHFTTKEEYESVKDKYKGWTIEYMKGLGSLSAQDWDMILSSNSAVYIPVVDDGKMKDILKLLFDKGDGGADARKEWLSTK